MVAHEREASADPLEDYRAAHERQQERLRAVYADRAFMEAAVEMMRMRERGDRTGWLTFGEFKRQYGLPT